MKRFCLLVLLGCFSFINSCDDGDVLDFEFDFEDTFIACEESDLLFYKIKEDPAETVSVLLTSLTLDELFTLEGLASETKEDSLKFQGGTVVFEEAGSFTYRTYNRPTLPPDVFCSLVPPANLNINVDEDSVCNVVIQRTLLEEDNDGIPSSLEGPNGIDPLGDDDNDGSLNYVDDEPNNSEIQNVNGMIETGFDTDGDGLPNFMDIDDDGDNVLTSSENPDPDNNEDLSDAQDTDGDGTPDYLDNDDDGDGVLTRDEENDTQNQNPLDDITNSVLGIADYLNENVTTSEPANAYRPHNISQTYTVRLIVEEIDISFLSQDIFDFGFLEGPQQLSGERIVTPEFP